MIFPDLKTPLLWVLGLGLVAALATAGIERTRAAGARADAATARKDLANYKLSVSETSRILQAANDRKAADNHARQLEAINAARSRETLAARVADDLRLDRDRLLDAVCVATRRNRLPSTVATAQAQPADPLADVFGQCTAEVQELVRAADDHASDVQALIDSWPR
ncbi:hypothetical protein [Variovorax boronicumulans]|uniref:hypothetical protein n=1 Tax=Variovorax boronicumulans TaxID=436515 RepID=UPI0012E48C94|nr:hypothetical protein [Variovorax boronicumulans]GER18973.1 hypothetical protein VCH24_40060 [Variovorax boronicumulans]